MKTVALRLATALAEIVGGYLCYRWLKQGWSIWLLVPAAASLAPFARRLTLHETAAGRGPRLRGVQRLRRGRGACRDGDHHVSQPR